MSSNELYQKTFSQDFTLASGTVTANIASNYYNNTSKIVGVSLKTAVGAVGVNNNPANIYVNVVPTAGAAGTAPTFACTMKNNVSNTDAGIYTLSWVNVVKNGLANC